MDSNAARDNNPHGLGIIDASPPLENQNDMSTEQQLSSAFRTAAMSVTQLYKDSLKNSKRAFQEGYVQALQDFVAFVHSHPQARSVSTSEGRDSARIPVGDLLEFANSRHAHVSDTAVGRGSVPAEDGFGAPPLSPQVSGTQQTPPVLSQLPQPPQPCPPSSQSQRESNLSSTQFTFTPPPPVSGAFGTIPTHSAEFQQQHQLQHHEYRRIEEQRQHQIRQQHIHASPSVNLNGLSLNDSSIHPTSHAVAGGMTGGACSPMDSLKRRYMPPTFAAPEMISFLGRPVNLSADGTNDGRESNSGFGFGIGNEPPSKKGRRE